VSYAAFKSLAAKVFGTTAVQSMDFGKRQIRSVAVVSGGASDLAAEAGRDRMDVFVTGEPALAAYSVAEEYGINVVYGGHYATEVFGVRALGNLLAKHFKVDAQFIDLAVPF
jgi:putative NIF3 family GTP cyclohydrolase 1 type 2